MKELYKALASFHKGLPVIKKEASVSWGNTNYKYATYEQIRAVINGRLSENNLLIVHSTSSVEGVIIVTTKVIHTISTEEIEAYLPALSKEPDNPQALGKSITYMKRYGLTSLLGLSCDEDPDALHASSNNNTPTVADMSPVEFDKYAGDLKSDDLKTKVAAYKALACAAQPRQLTESQKQQFTKIMVDQKKAKNENMTYEELNKPRTYTPEEL